jgi:transcriptional regulator
MSEQNVELLQGTLDLLILKTLALRSLHGYAISARIQQVSNNALRVQEGSLYPALHRLEYRGWIRSQWGASENNRRAKYYQLTELGRRQLTAETENWNRLTDAVARILQAT